MLLLPYVLRGMLVELDAGPLACVHAAAAITLNPRFHGCDEAAVPPPAALSTLKAPVFCMSVHGAGAGCRRVLRAGEEPTPAGRTGARGSVRSLTGRLCANEMRHFAENGENNALRILIIRFLSGKRRINCLFLYNSRSSTRRT